MNEGRVGSQPPLEKSVVVELAPDDAFRVFTIGIARWWPLLTHSVGKASASTCVFEEGVGGRIYESDADGAEHEWGRILVWEPPTRVVYSWYPGRDGTTAQEVEVRFTASGEGTEAALTHRGWETLGDMAEEIRNEYDGGWDYVLGCFVERGGE